MYLTNYNRVLSTYDSYHSEPLRRNGSEWLRGADVVAYFCAEFGFHESLPIYSGGLGILAGDHCKAASDMALPFVGIGLQYRQGYFHQTIDAQGRQNAAYFDSDFEDLPVRPVLDEAGAARMVSEYLGKFYLRAAKQGARYAEDGYRPARELASWKARVRAAWPGVGLRRIDLPQSRIHFGESVLLEVGVTLNGLGPRDVTVEVLFDPSKKDCEPLKAPRLELAPDGTLTAAGECRFALKLEPDLCGKLDYRIRCFPNHELLTHSFELGLMVWLQTIPDSGCYR